MFKGDREYDKGDEETVGTTSPFPEPGGLGFYNSLNMQLFVFHQVRTRYPGVEALIRGNALHVDGRRFIWKGQVLNFYQSPQKSLCARALRSKVTLRF